MPPVKSRPTDVSSASKHVLSKKKKKRFFKKPLPSKPANEPSVEEKPKKISKNPARLPATPEEASSNWKDLIAKIKPVQTKQRLIYLEKKRKMMKDTVVIEKTKPPEESSVNKNEVKKLDIWFDDVDPILLDPEDLPSVEETCKNPETKPSAELTKIIALDCEMVGIGEDGKDSALARVSIVNQHGVCVYDKFVAPGDEVTDYRTQFSGIRPHNLENALELGTVCHEVASILKGRILVGHALNNDLEVLLIKHPKGSIRDTSKYKPFRALAKGGTPSLKRLAQHFLGIEIQSGEHSSIQDAQAALRLYTMFRQQWETDLTARRLKRRENLVTSKKKNIQTKK